MDPHLSDASSVSSLSASSYQSSRFKKSRKTNCGCSNTHMVSGNPKGDGLLTSIPSTVMVSHTSESTGIPALSRKLSLPSISTQGIFLVPDQEQFSTPSSAPTLT